MIILLTDFGPSEYVGVMKGVIYSIDDRAVIVDLCHDISPQSVVEAAWILKNNFRYFPEGSVFCCVVDPGVGTERKALAVKTSKYYFVAPDNGLLWETLKEQKIIEIRQLTIPPEASNTFHGRDVFAPAAAKINQGYFDDLGEKITEIEKLELYQQPGAGLVVRIDRFGNIITNLPDGRKDAYTVEIDDKKYLLNYYRNYADAPEGEIFLIEGSNNTLEISLKNGSANEKLNIKTAVTIKIT